MKDIDILKIERNNVHYVHLIRQLAQIDFYNFFSNGRFLSLSLSPPPPSPSLGNYDLSRKRICFDKLSIYITIYLYENIYNISTMKCIILNFTFIYPCLHVCTCIMHQL